MVLIESFSGIRGIYDIDLDKEIIKKYANAFSNYLVNRKSNPRIVIGMDSRTSGNAIKNIFFDFLNAEILDVGILPTPIIENAVRAFSADAGIIITASHNEPEFNGFKFLDKDGAILRPKDINEIINNAHKINNFLVFNNKITNKHQQAIEVYKEFIKNILGDFSSKRKILVDPNGGSGIVAKEIFSSFGINAEFVNMDYSKFKRKIEPTKESLSYLKEQINNQDAEFAAGFDCDADRVEFLLNNGELVSGNHILGLFADYILSKSSNPENQVVVVNDATSYLVKEISEKYKASFIEVEVGEINVVDKMNELNSIIGGEGSNGGIIITPSKCRDGILAVLFLLKIIEDREKNLSQLFEELPEYFYKKEKISLNQDFAPLRNKIKQYYILRGFLIPETGDSSGGIKAIKNNSWIWFRQSKTEGNMLRIIADSKDKAACDNLLKEAISLFS